MYLTGDQHAAIRRLFEGIADCARVTTQETVTDFWNTLLQISTYSENKRDVSRELLDANARMFRRHLTVLEEIAALSKVMEGGKIVRYRLEPEQFTTTEIAKSLHRREVKNNKRKKKPEAVVAQVVSKPERPHAPSRKKLEPCIAIFIDLPNCVNYRPEGSIRPLEPARINWANWKRVLAMYRGVSLPVERAILCVSEMYADEHRAALAEASKYFTIAKMEKDKDVDPVMFSKVTRMILDHLYLEKSERLPVLNIVSGDKDFGWILDTLLPDIERAGLALSLRVTSWKRKLAHVLAERAHEIAWIDDTLTLVDPHGSAMLNLSIDRRFGIERRSARN